MSTASSWRWAAAACCANWGADAGALAAEAERLERQGRTVSWLLRRSGAAAALLGLLAFGDAVKPAAREAVARLHALGVRTVMLTGDNRGSAAAVARELGIDRRARRSAARRQGRRGAGTARTAARWWRWSATASTTRRRWPPPTSASRMSTGTDVAMETAGITLMRGDPRLVADALDVSRRTYATIRRGLFWAFAYNVVGIPLAAAGPAEPGDRRRGDGLQQRQRGRQCAAAAALARECHDRGDRGTRRRAAPGGGLRETQR